jgi:uncharacterized protein (TIGR03435 family)
MEVLNSTKRRMALILQQRIPSAGQWIKRVLRFSRSRVLIAALELPGLFAMGRTAIASAQAAATKTDIVATWQGTLHIASQKDLRIVLKVTKTDAGVLKATNYSIDQGGQGIPVSTISFQDGELKFSVDQIDGTYDGKMAPDGKSVTGQWKQGPNPLQLIFERATTETAWAIPEPPPRLPAMAKDADPSFDVATVKPSKPDTPGKMFRMQANKFSTINTTLADLMKDAYGIQDKQIVSAPAWVFTEKYDLAGQPDVPGQPSQDQLRIMIKKLLADRFQLKFHKDQKEMPAYVLTVAKGGPKMKKSEADPNAGGGRFFRGLGVLTFTNSNMVDFCDLLQAAVLDRPVVDHTDLPGKWDFLLKWTPDESQFGGMGIKVPPPSEAAADAPPPLFVALQEQIGLKLDAEKAQVPVLIIDHAEKPGDN